MTHDETMASGFYMPEAVYESTRSDEKSRHLEFHGNAKDYFRIWIVNVALSLVTLGIYSAWATVRTRRYMYASTALDGTPFEYLAKPLPILRGRLLTALIFAIYVAAGHFSKPLQAITALVVAAFMPWLIVKSLMFRARYSAWRGLRFYFTDDYMGAYKWYLGVYFLMGIPFVAMALASLAGHPGFGALLAFAGIAGIFPWIKGNQQQWTIENHHFGGKSFKFCGAIGDYYSVFAKTLGVAVAWLVPTSLLMGGLIFAITKAHLVSFNPKAPSLLMLALVYLCMAPFYLGVWTLKLGSYRFRCTLPYWPMLGIYLTNGLAILCTIGLATPWARIRLARYRARHMEISGAGDLNDFVRDAFAHGDIGAAASEMDSLLGIDISL